MQYDEDEIDERKYFLDSNREKIYAEKGSGHKVLAYKILHNIGLDMLYYYYEDRVPAAMFLIYCGYVLVDEAERRYKLKLDDFGYESTDFTAVGYCSVAIDEDYIEYLNNEYGVEGNIVEDRYETADIKEKKLIDEIIEKVKAIRESRKEEKYEEREQDENER